MKWFASVTFPADDLICMWLMDYRKQGVKEKKDLKRDWGQIGLQNPDKSFMWRLN